MYLPNLLQNYGEEAPIQPLLYQNTKKGSEIINNYTVIVDSGNASDGGFAGADNAPTGYEYDLRSNSNNSVTTLVGTFPWHKFRVKFDEQFKIDKITDVYLKSITIIGATALTKCAYFVLNIEEFNLRSVSNNPELKSKIVIQNTITSGGVDSVFTKSYTKLSNHITTITPSNYTNLNITLTNENGKGADDGDEKTFFDRTSKKIVLFLSLILLFVN